MSPDNRQAGGIAGSEKGGGGGFIFKPYLSYILGIGIEG